jgi:exosortase
MNAGARDTGAAAPSSVSGALRRAAPWAGCAALAALAYRELSWSQPEQALPEGVEEWFFVPSASLTPAVLLLALWLLFRRWRRLRALPAQPGSPGVGAALLAAGGALYLWATHTGASDLLVPSLMLNALAGAWLWRGAAAVRAVLLPVAFLGFALPLPAPLLNEVIFALQIGTTELAGAILYVLGVPHSVSGERIARPGNTFSVIESCSGLRSMQTLALVSVLMADLFRRRGLHAWLLVLAAFPVGFALNGLRAVLLILNPHSSIAAIHTLQGVAILLGGLLLLFALDGLLAWVLPRAPRAAGPGPPVAGPARGAPALAAALALALAASLWLPRYQPAPAGSLGASARVATALGSLSSSPLETDELFLGSAGFRESFTWRFAGRGADPVVLFLGVGDRAVRERSPLSPKTALPGSGWIVEDEFPVTLEPGGRRARARVLRSGSSRVLVYHWTEGAASWPLEVLRALLALDRSAFRRPGDIVVVRIGTSLLGSVPEGKAQAEERLVSFYHLLRPLLDGLENELG